MDYLKIVAVACVVVVTLYSLYLQIRPRAVLAEVLTEGMYLRVVYRWTRRLSHEKADKLDTKARMVIAERIGLAARIVGLRCARAPKYGIRHAWFLQDYPIPFSVVQAGFDGESCWAEMGPIAMDPRSMLATPKYGISEQLALGFKAIAKTLYL